MLAIDRTAQAPVSVPPERCMELLADVEGYPRWSSLIKSAEPAGERVRIRAELLGVSFEMECAPDRIVPSGRMAIVLEARPDRVGGRLESALHEGHEVDLGGAWIGAQDARAATLARDLGIPTWRTHCAGEPVVIHDGRRMRGRGYKLRHLASTLDSRRVARRL